MRRIAMFLGMLLVGLVGHTQLDDPVLQKSEFGWYVSPHGTIRVLLVFAEIDYDVNPSKDPQANGAEHWPKGQLPNWKNNLFDPHALATPKATVSRYYHDASLGHFTVLGDYFPELITLKESEHRSMGWYSRAVAKELNKNEEGFRTAHGLSVQDFDLWKDRGKPGMPKEEGADDPHSFDHVMVILRNSTLTHGQGSVDQGSPGKIFGYESDTQSRFGGMNALPFDILKHEFNHMLLGGNNFHSGGGNASAFESYQLCQQGGWSLMGAANSSILTASAWDRQRLGWTAENSEHLVRAWREDGTECNGDLDPLKGDTGIYILGDMATTGDAIRIKIPHIPEEEFQQWIWLENHQGHQRNGVPTDRYMWESLSDCVTPFYPGIYAQLQIDREVREGRSIFGGFADYLKPMPANGNHDLMNSEVKMDNVCPFNGSSFVFDRNTGGENPLTGFHEMELPVYDKNSDNVVQRKEHYVPFVRHVDGRFDAQVVFNGRPEHAFTVTGTNEIGIGTNPSTANTLTLVRSGTRYKYGMDAPNVREVHLNQISLELIEDMPNGRIKIRVKAYDPYINEDVRWAADSIVLHPAVDEDQHALILQEGRSIKLDRSITPTRNDDPELYREQLYFNGPTILTVMEGSSVLLNKGSTLELTNGSTMHLLPGSELVLEAKAKLKIGRDSKVIVHPGAKITKMRKAKVDCSGGGCVVSDEGQ